MSDKVKVLLVGAVALAITVVVAVVASADEASRVMQEISCTIKAESDYSGGGSQGSGVIYTREVKCGDKTEKVHFIWTAAHVVDDLREVKTTIAEGLTVKKVYFKDAAIVKEFRQEGRSVGETKLYAKILCYSDADDGHDLALLVVRMHDYLPGSAVFDETEILEAGTDLVHCGSLNGQMGSNSITKGCLSQVGRVYEGQVFDQTSVPAFPGSSGGGVFVVEGAKPRYVGMITRGAGETFNLMVPVRRIREFCAERGIEWAINPKVEVPPMKDLLKIEPETDADTGPQGSDLEVGKKGVSTMEFTQSHPTWIGRFVYGD